MIGMSKPQEHQFRKQPWVWTFIRVSCVSWVINLIWKLEGFLPPFCWLRGTVLPLVQESKILGCNTQSWSVPLRRDAEKAEVFNCFVSIINKWGNCTLLASAVNTLEKGVMFLHGQESKLWIFHMSTGPDLDHRVILFSCLISISLKFVEGGWGTKKLRKRTMLAYLLK